MSLREVALTIAFRVIGEIIESLGDHENARRR